MPEPTTAITWPMVSLALVNQLPSIITAAAAVLAAVISKKNFTIGHENKRLIQSGVAGVEEVKKITNGNFHELREQLKHANLAKDAAESELREIHNRRKTDPGYVPPARNRRRTDPGYKPPEHPEAPAKIELKD